MEEAAAQVMPKAEEATVLEATVVAAVAVVADSGVVQAVSGVVRHVAALLWCRRQKDEGRETPSSSPLVCVSKLSPPGRGRVTRRVDVGLVTGS